MHIVGYARNGMLVQIDLIRSAAAASISRQPHLLTLAAEALTRITLRKPEQIIEYDMGHDIGYDFVVKTVASHAVFYAKLVKDSTYTRFVKNVKPLTSTYLTLQLRQSADGSSYLLEEARIGHSVPPRPGSLEENDLSRPYWAEHAYIFDNPPVQPQTLTKECPY